jgi:hypothetical protein
MTVPKIELSTPFIHNNGDRGDVLLDRITTAYMAVSDAMDKLRHCTPNGRNAYPVDGLMQRLEAQHRQRQEYLQAVLDSLEGEANAVADEVKS